MSPRHSSPVESQAAKGGFRFPGVHSAIWPLAALAIAAGLQFTLVLRRAINWDEFWYYSLIEKFAAGSLSNPLQTVHVHLFGWLVALPGNGVDHIVTGRLFMAGAEFVTLTSIAAIAAHFTDRKTGLLCALAFLSSIFVFQHGFSFRVDPLAAALAMASLAILLKARLGPLAIAAFALLLGLAGMVTIKAILLAPAFAGIAWLRLAEARRPIPTAARIAACVIAAATTFGLLYWLHSAALDQNLGVREVQSGGTFVKGAANYAIALGLPAYPQYVLKNVTHSPLQAALLIAAPFAILRSGLSRDRKIALAGLLATGLVFFLYRNTLPYFYAFILPPIVCAAAPAMRLAVQRSSALIAAGALLASTFILWLAEPASPIDKQRRIIDAAEEIFPSPVAYFDFCAMLGTFEKVSPFMTTWGMDRYRQAGVPVLRRRMERVTVPLVLASEQQAYLTFEQLLTTSEPSSYFLEEDAEALRGNYIHFWGPFWLAGKTIAPGEAEQHDEFLVPGPYTVHDAAIRVNGTVHEPGDIITLQRGDHMLQVPGDESARLMWGEALREPRQPPPERPFWTDF